jgi:hypothetical protein
LTPPSQAASSSASSLLAPSTPAATGSSGDVPTMPPSGSRGSD